MEISTGDQGMYSSFVTCGDLFFTVRGDLSLFSMVHGPLTVFTGSLFAKLRYLPPTQTSKHMHLYPERNPTPNSGLNSGFFCSHRNRTLFYCCLNCGYV